MCEWTDTDISKNRLNCGENVQGKIRHSDLFQHLGNDSIRQSKTCSWYDISYYLKVDIQRTDQSQIKATKNKGQSDQIF